MITDPLFYRLFQTSPETFFLLLGMSSDQARDMAARYQYESIEFKATSHRVDGVFLPKEPGLLLYFLEVQFYYLPTVFADLMVKVFTYLKKNDPGQAYCGVVLFASRSLEPKESEPYQEQIKAGKIRCFYMDEMTDLPDAPLGLSILHLIAEAESSAPEKARELILRVKAEIKNDGLRDDLIDWIETVIIYKLPAMTREEIQTMLQAHDIRETRVYKDAVKEGIEIGKEEGIEIGKEEGMEKGIEKGLMIAIAKMAANNMTAEQIANILELDVEMVREAMKNQQA